MKVIILCTGNSCRSQMAEGFFREYLKKYIQSDQFTVLSAGLETHGVNPRAVQVMSEVGIDISGHTSNNVSEYISQKFDYIITVCDNAAQSCPTFPGEGIRLHWPFDDPAKAVGTDEEILNQFCRVRDEIGLKIKQWLENKFNK